jgi:hypothetical protein
MSAKTTAGPKVAMAAPPPIQPTGKLTKPKAKVKAPATPPIPRTAIMVPPNTTITITSDDPKQVTITKEAITVIQPKGAPVAANLTIRNEKRSAAAGTTAPTTEQPTS